MHTLIVLDNFEGNPEIIINLLSKCSGKKSVIVTSTQPDISSVVYTAIEIRSFSPEDGGSFFNHLMGFDITGRKESLSQQLAVVVGGLPLAIAHIAGMLQESSMSLEELISRLQSEKQTLNSIEQRPFQLPLSYTRILSTLWTKVFQNLSPEEAEVLDVLSFLDPDEIQRDLFGGYRTSFHFVKENGFVLSMTFNFAEHN